MKLLTLEGEVTAIKRKGGRIRRLRVAGQGFRLGRALGTALAQEVQEGDRVRLWATKKGAVLVVPLAPRAQPRPIAEVCIHKHCARRGAQEVLEAARELPDLEVETVRCLGHCQCGPNVGFGGTVLHEVQPAEVPLLFKHPQESRRVSTTTASELVPRGADSNGPPRPFSD